ncbi:microtubule-associated protein 3 [Sesamum angolense]|uniref:Microtubule-associated protein 3 n=1 Tax=Sesamum angolense TaxID=2727404 RepID=A0AAE2BGW5_9LAMI|nr:microtubule-associated protein 3 [Sesamum angolense]
MPSQMETTCGSLLNELQIIWDEVGESDAERDRMLLELEQECMEVYRRKVDQANKCRAQLRQAIADAEAELAAICSAMGERPVHIRQSDQSTGSLKAELRAILPEIEEMRKRKKLEELHRELQALQKEKSERLKQVLEHLNYLYSCCSVLGLDFKQTVCGIHPSLGESEGSKSISNDTIEQLGTAIQKLREVKVQRMQQLQDLATSLLELWNLMDTPIEEQQTFQKVTCNIASSEEEITEPGMLSADFIDYVKAEVSRLEELKASKMKELVLKKKTELEDICRKTHLIPESDSAIDLAVDAVESGAVDASFVLEQIELQISRVKEEALGRKEILEKVEKWMTACQEESWLEEYNRDDNRYNAGRGAHLTLKRAEKARALVNKLPAMVDTLTSKTTAWEKEKGVDFTYDGVSVTPLTRGNAFDAFLCLPILKFTSGFCLLCAYVGPEETQEQLLTEQEALYGSKPSPMKNQSAKKGRRLSCGGGPSNRRLSLGGPMLQTPKADMMPPLAKATPNTRNAKKLNVHNVKLTKAALGRRGLDLAGLPINQHSFNLQNAREIESPIIRKPFSPISSTDSSKSSATNILEALNRKHNEMLPKTITSDSTPFSTPSKTVPIADVENRTPQAMAIIPSTPSTISIPMQMAITPAPAQMPITPAPIQKALIPAPTALKSVDEEIEYSFEEKRAGFVLPRSHPINVMQI